MNPSKCWLEFNLLAFALLTLNYICQDVAKCFGDVQLNRLEAMSLLKELVAINLVDPTYLHVSLRKLDDYQIQIKCDHNKEIEMFAKKHGLKIEEDKERKYLVIYKE